MIANEGNPREIKIFRCSRPSPQEGLCFTLELDFIENVMRNARIVLLERFRQ